MTDNPIRQAEWPSHAWRLRLELATPSWSLPAIQYAIFSQDPVPEFKAVFSRMEKSWVPQLNEITDVERRKTVEQLQLAWAWNHLFRRIPGDEVGLLTSEDVLMCGSAAGKKWFVSKPVQIGHRRLCWSVPFEAVAGQEAAVKLTENTALDLAIIEGTQKPE